MAVAAFKATLGIAVPSGGYSASAAHGKPDPRAAAATADTEVAAAQALEAAVSDARAAAAANGVIAGDGTALGLVNAIQTAFDLLIAQNVIAKAATLAAKNSVASGDMIVLVDSSVIATKNKFAAALEAIRRLTYGSGGLTDV